MKKTFTILLLFANCLVFGQNLPQIPRCMSPEAIDYQETITPGFSQLVIKEFEKAKAHGQLPIEKSGSLYTIPVVVHVVYNNAAQNLDDSVIINQIMILNQDYNRLNEDTVNMRTDFEIVKGNPQINFVLAGIDPDGNPTNGITRTSTATQSFGSIAIIGGDFSDLEKVKSTADGGHDPWDLNRYLNIWVCNMSVNFFGQEITALLGYATPPAGLPNWPPGSTNGLVDGVVIQYHAFGSNNPNELDMGSGPYDFRGRTPVHEVGHYLGLRHIWGDGDCTAEDGIDDTPNADAQSSQDCDTTKNTCVDAIQSIDLPDMVENYMDYSAETCQNTFTQGQVDLMHGVLEDQRYDLVHDNPASVNEMLASSFNLFPNPTEGKFKVKSNALILTWKLTDASGKKVDESLLEQFEFNYDLHYLERGIYYLTLITDEGSSSVKVIKL